MRAFYCDEFVVAQSHRSALNAQTQELFRSGSNILAKKIFDTRAKLQESGQDRNMSVFNLLLKEVAQEAKTSLTKFQDSASSVDHQQKQRKLYLNEFCVCVFG